MRWLVLGMIAIGCGPRIEVAADGGTSGTAGTGTTELTSATTSSGTTSSTGSETSTSGDDSSDDADDGRTFITPNPDAGDSTIECDVWAQNCPRGEKCMPWAHDGGGSWTATRCVPIDADPKAPGEACSVVESSVSGIDDCELGAMCWNVDSETNTGECVAMCHGTAMNPLCADPCETCQIMNAGVLTLCLQNCNPLVSSCGEGQVCYASAGGFACFADVQTRASHGDPCTFVNDCDPGHFCAPVDDVPNCKGDAGCCVRFCDVDAPDACDSVAGTTCVPWFDEGRGPAKSCGASTEIGTCLVAR